MKGMMWICVWAVCATAGDLSALWLKDAPAPVSGQLERADAKGVWFQVDEGRAFHPWETIQRIVFPVQQKAEPETVYEAVLTLTNGARFPANLLSLNAKTAQVQTPFSPEPWMLSRDCLRSVQYEAGAVADQGPVVRLKNGDVLEGKILALQDGRIQVSVNKRPMEIPAAVVAAIRFSGKMDFKPSKGALFCVTVKGDGIPVQVVKIEQGVLRGELAGNRVSFSLNHLKSLIFYRVPADLRVIADARLAALEGLNEGSKAAQDRQLSDVAKGMPLEVETKASDIRLRWVPAGNFTMGSPKDEKGRTSAEEPHEVTISKGLWVGKYEVTRTQWKAVMGSDPSHFKDGPSDAPVEQVSWEACQTFLKKLCKQEGVPVGTYRLLTEAEWEYACRAGTTGPCAGSDLKKMAWYHGNSEGKPHLVGQKQANAWGLHDMHGNVWEWCSDWYGDYPKVAQTDSVGAGSGSFRVFRGGSWGYNAWYCRSAFRGRGSPGYRNFYLGLRLARVQLQ